MSAMSELHADLTHAGPLVTDGGNSLYTALDELERAVDRDVWSFKLMVALAACHLDARSRGRFLAELENAARRNRELSSPQRLTD